ncbi:MAG: methyltransferase domain-containing protein [Proteobacteria bacterium]|nr:methyltransferase domain-containing protein [Pseudomonadota bacterium]
MLSSPATRLHEWTLSDGDRLAVESFDFWAEMRAFATQVQGTVLHVGSKVSIVDRSGHCRDLFPLCRFVGLDSEAGPNVDAVCDISVGVHEIRRRCKINTADAVICRHVLGHVPNPWQAARNLEFLLRPGGLLIVAVPWVQGYHPFPEDYWRMSFSGVHTLFARVAFELEFYTGAREDTGYRLLLNGAPVHDPRTCRIERNLFQLVLDQPPEQDMFEDRPGKKITLSRLFMPACSVNLIGRKGA